MERKRIPSHEGYYASRDGRVWRKRNGRFVLVKPVMHGVGYQYTWVHSKKYLTQRLVCEAFKGEAPEDCPVCVRKANRQSPKRVRSNKHLKWGNLSQCQRGKIRPFKLSEQDKEDIVAGWKNGRTQLSLADEFGVTQAAIRYTLIRRSAL